METYEAIMTRRSIPKTGDGVPDRARIARLLDAAVAAPNHHLTQPWRFVVLAVDALKELGDALAEHAARTDGRPEIARDLPQRAPVIITVIDRAGHDHHVSEIDEHYAVGAAIQNILLAAHDDGFAAMIRTHTSPRCNATPRARRVNRRVHIHRLPRPRVSPQAAADHAGGGTDRVAGLVAAQPASHMGQSGRSCAATHMPRGQAA